MAKKRYVDEEYYKTRIKSLQKHVGQITLKSHFVKKKSLRSHLKISKISEKNPKTSKISKKNPKISKISKRFKSLFFSTYLLLGRNLNPLHFISTP